MGFVLIKWDDTAPKGQWRRQQSHNAQIRPDRCSGGRYLRWFTASQEMDAEEARLSGLEHVAVGRPPRREVSG